MIARILFSATTLSLSALLFTSVFAKWSLPGATPDPVLVSLVALAMAGGMRVGAVNGFAAGLLLDLIPPAVVPIGTNAFTLCVVGAAVGRFTRRNDRTVNTTLIAVASAALGAQLLRAIMGLVARDGRVDILGTPILGLSGALYGVLLAPFIVPALHLVYAKLPRTAAATVPFGAR